MVAGTVVVVVAGAEMVVVVVTGAEMVVVVAGAEMVVVVVTGAELPRCKCHLATPEGVGARREMSCGHNGGQWMWTPIRLSAYY